ncbi:MAG: hypothetical protein ABIS68_12270 [Casimicrobiaceae bacterium]
MIIFPLLFALLALGALSRPNTLALVAVGVLAGVLLGRLGLGKTSFEATPAGLYYTPNAHLGIALSLLLVGRVIYRLLEV